MTKQTIDAKRFGLACGTLWAAGILFMGITGWLFDAGPTTWQVISEWYIGSGPTLFGTGIGIIWAFVDGCIGGYILTTLYNKF